MAAFTDGKWLHECLSPLFQFIPKVTVTVVWSFLPRDYQEECFLQQNIALDLLPKLKVYSITFWCLSQ